ncbi:hypothetical protein EPUS_01290 [Endocarpon pusillum Z07020]|uniref:HIG1 domain-containing protein n=1 Tax=Endocarpon pusillum (strain Z07020 / HMAS-L-300199) TaxID=1263415 RepID=U1I1V6_ENDPU|nr:uncharacterized protein EPUS_01290 [Endocarpon pusillum Z07020]ERF75924.1 hypothetical protein EPUS_01290 [Endocarpon pusillum Z07020]
MADSTAAPPPGPPSAALPSSFDSNPEFFEEKRMAKLARRIREEPLIPLGVAATCYALYQAIRSSQVGDHHRTNRMFRARIYAQGFTLLAMVGGSIYWKDDRMKRKELEKVLVEKKAAEKREKWLRELEERDREDREWRSRFEGVAARAKEAEEGAMLRLGAGKGKREKKAVEGGEGVVEAVKNGANQMKESVREGTGHGKESLQGAKAVAEQVEEGAKQGKQSMKQAIEKAFQNKTVLEQVQISGWGSGTWFIREAWRRR